MLDARRLVREAEHQVSETPGLGNRATPVVCRSATVVACTD